jgi:hypothetical protein
MISFIPRIEAATIGDTRFDLLRMDGVRAWLKVQREPSSIERFHIHCDDVATIVATVQAGVPYQIGRNASFNTGASV